MTIHQIVKASLFTLILAFMVIGTIAIAEVMKKEQPVGEERAVATQTWYFVGDDPYDPNDYSDEPEAISCTGIAERICQIEAPDDGGFPELGPSQVADIEAAIASLNDEPMGNTTVKSFRSHL